MSTRWSHLRVCGIPITSDPAQDIHGDLEVLDGELLVIELQMKDGVVIGATGHVARNDSSHLPPQDTDTGA